MSIHERDGHLPPHERLLLQIPTAQVVEGVDLSVLYERHKLWKEWTYLSCTNS